MIIRKAEYSDIASVMEIVNEARAYFAAAGIPQWQGEYPSEADFKDDIEGGRLYVAEDGEILGVYCYDTRGDENYNEIFEGSFRLYEPYAAIHRVAVSGKAKGRGIAGRMVDHAASLARGQGFRYMRGDTHRLNISMQKMLTKNGFEHRGIIYLGGKRDDENERFAFDRVLK
ncbi:MAG: GNAT family N-acetyltransferase [Clostridia bacterium]|nr:GNAT family N-acetyltransferase [Clostridia bacterium]